MSPIQRFGDTNIGFMFSWRTIRPNHRRATRGIACACVPANHNMYELSWIASSHFERSNICRQLFDWWNFFSHHTISDYSQFNAKYVNVDSLIHVAQRSSVLQCSSNAFECLWIAATNEINSGNFPTKSKQIFTNCASWNERAQIPAILYFIYRSNCFGVSGWSWMGLEHIVDCMHTPTPGIGATPTGMWMWWTNNTQP